MQFDLNSPVAIAAIVVAALVIIYFSKPKPKAEEIQYESIQQKQVAVSKVSASGEENKEQNDLELAAVIMGALSAYLGTDASKLKIKSIKRVDGNNSTWRKEALKP